MKENNNIKRNLRFYLSIAAARLTGNIIRLAGGKGSHWPGKIALRLCPDFLVRIARPELVLAITGTNGKTTTANLLADTMRELGYDFAHNSHGSNIKEGVTTAMIQSASFWGSPKKNCVLLEVDERASRVIFPELIPDYLIITNLFRESYARNAHVEFIAGVLEESIPESTTLIVNADDLICSRLRQNNLRYTFNIDRLPGEEEELPRLIDDLPLCPNCRSKLHFSFRRYNHLGKVHCPVCGLENLPADFSLKSHDEMLRVQVKGEIESYPPAGETIQDDYNALVAITMLRILGHDAGEIAEAMTGKHVVTSRKEIIKAGSATIFRTLAKGSNPIAVTRGLITILRLPGTKSVILLYNASQFTSGYSDMTAWYYDTDFELLADPQVKQIVITGARMADIKVRLLLAGIPENKLTLCPDSTKIAEAVSLDQDNICILHELYSEPLAETTQSLLAQKLDVNAKL